MATFPKQLVPYEDTDTESDEETHVNPRPKSPVSSSVLPASQPPPLPSPRLPDAYRNKYKEKRKTDNIALQ